MGVLSIPLITPGPLGLLTNLLELLNLGLIEHGEDIGAGSTFCSLPGSSGCLQGPGEAL